MGLYAGGGVVADSTPEGEYEETEAKALGLCRSLGVVERPALSNESNAGARGGNHD